MKFQKQNLRFFLTWLVVLGFVMSLVSFPSTGWAAPSDISTVAGNGSTGFSGDGVLATTTSLHVPSGVAVDSAGNLFIADQVNKRIRKVAVGTGIITTVAGNGSGGYSGDGGPATSAELNLPNSVTVDSSGNLFIADSSNHRIRKVNTLGVITTVAGDGTSGFSGDSGPATSAQMAFPGDVAVDSSGNLFIADQRRVRKVDTLGTITTYAGTGVSGPLGDGGPATSASIGFVDDIAVDASGNVYIADGSNHRVRKVDTLGIITTVAGNGVGGFTGDGGLATSANLNSPRGVFVDSINNLYIVDFINARLRKVNGSGVIATIAGNGSFGFSGDGGPALSASFNDLFDVAVSTAGDIFLADQNNHRIRKVEAPVLTVLSITPAQNAIDIDSTSNIEIVFAGALNTSTVNQTSLPIYDSFVGLVPGSYSFTTTNVANDTVLFDPTTAFRSGVKVEAIVTPVVEAADGFFADPFVTHFFVQSSSGGGAVGAEVTYNIVGTDANGVSSGDFDLDGDLDLAVAEEGAGDKVAVLFNDGSGLFSGQVDYSAPNARAVVVADYNRDGSPDLGVVHSFGPEVFGVFLNNGSGTFLAESTIAIGAAPNNAVAADLDGDGDIDVVTTNRADDSVSVLLNNGTGTFAAQVVYGVGDFPFNLDDADFDEDGDIDIVTANGGSDNFSVLLNNGDGSFAAAMNYASTIQPYGATAVDLNGDGFPDIALSSGDTSGANVAIHLNNGDGTFAANVNYPGGNAMHMIHSADLDADGDMDLATSDGNDATISIYLNNGNGIFPFRQAYSTPTSGIASLHLADIDQNGSLDFLATGFTYLKVHLNTIPPLVCGNGLLQAPETCDDGNVLDGDGCSSVCLIEGGGRRRTQGDVDQALGVQGQMSSSTGSLSEGSLAEAGHQAALEEASAASSPLIALQQLFSWMDPTDYELTAQSVQIRDVFEFVFALKNTLKTLALVTGYSDGYTYKKPTQESLLDVAQLMKAIMISFSECFSPAQMERALRHDFAENAYWWAGYWHFLDPLMQRFLGQHYLLWTPLDQLDVLEVLEVFLSDYCEENA